MVKVSNSDNNELWTIQTGFIAGYTEDKELMRRIRRNKTTQHWSIMAEYHDLKSPKNKMFARQYMIPRMDRRHAERMLNVKLVKT